MSAATASRLSRLAILMHPLGQALWVVLSRAQRFKNGPSRLSQHIAEDERQFDSCLFEYFLHPIYQTGTLLNQAYAESGQIA